MKASKKVIAILLAVLTVVSCVGTAAFADNTRTVKQYGAGGGYLALGDSIARGVNATPDNYKEAHNFYDRTVNGSYPYLVAQAVGCNIKDDARDKDSNFWPVCFHGQTLAMTMDLLGIEDNYYDDVFAHGEGKDAFHYYPIMQELYGNANEYLCNAGLITIGFGLSDVFYRAVIVAQMKNAEVDAGFVGDVVANIAEGYEYWVKAYPILLSYIKEHNPDAAVVLVGNYNVGGDTPLSDDILIPIGMAASTITGYMDSYLKQWAKEYGCIYCDITNAETIASQEDIGILGMDSDSLGDLCHLSPDGNALVARNILNLLPDENDNPKTVTTDIVVDLGRFTKVNYVMLDGKLLGKNSYSMNGYELTIPYGSHKAKNLTVAVVGDKGKTSVYTYSLAFDTDSGYKAYIIYGANDLISAIRTVFLKTASIFKNIGDLFKFK